MYDCIIIGGGVAGLALAIQLADAGTKVILIEKETYPFHKVCGEYVSNESRGFLKKLGLDLETMLLPHIHSLLLTSPSGIAVKRPLDVGGIGISRYRMDKMLADIAEQKGVLLLQGIKVQDVNFERDVFDVQAGGKSYSARVVCGSYGKKSNLDVKLDRNYVAPENKLYVGIKYHIRTSFDADVVEMHNFNGGYCGLSAVEDGLINMSYITKASNLRKSGNDIAKMEATILSSNPYLRRYFNTAEFVFKKPLAISHIAFEARGAVAGHMLMVGDAAGSIAPLSGNGMSMAMQASKIVASCITQFLKGAIGRSDMEAEYDRLWSAAFKKRIDQTRLIHATFGKPFLTDACFCVLKVFPFLIDMGSKEIHGDQF